MPKLGHESIEERRRRNSECHKGISCSEEHKQKMREIAKNNPFFGFKGKKHKPASIEKMKESHKGQIPWNKGLKGVMKGWNKRNDLRENSEEIIRLYKEDLLNTKEISERYNCKEDIIRVILEEHKAIMGVGERRRVLTKAGKITAWSKGLTKEMDHRIKPCSPERKEMMRQLGLSLKGKPKSPEAARKSAETRRKLFAEGKLIHPNLGKHLSEETRKKQSAARQGIPLEEWNRFVSFEPYTLAFNKLFKEFIRQREGFMCLKCGIREEDVRQLFKQNLHVHHIDYNKENTLKENCCSLCLRCNIEANTNRPHWTKFFQSLLSERYGYQYDSNQNIIINLNNQIKFGRSKK